MFDLDLMLAALERHYDFLSGELLAPPVGPLADALSAMKEQRAAPLLARHLNDPSTEVSDVERAARALSSLATPEELPSLRTFFALYRATADEPEHEEHRVLGQDKLYARSRAETDRGEQRQFSASLHDATQ